MPAKTTENNIRVTKWCYTKQGEKDIPWDPKKMKFQISEPEIAPTTNQKHFQGFIILHKNQRLTYLKEIDKEAHWEPAKGTIDDNIKYCSKDGKATQNGKRGNCGQGKRTDLSNVTDALKQGANLGKIVKDYTNTFTKFSNGIIKSKYFLDKEAAQNWRTVNCYVYWGETGAGKTRSAITYAKDNNKSWYILNSNSNGTLWFDGYDSEQVLIVDDFYGWIKQHELLRICDGYPYHCQVKGAYTWAMWDTVIFTSNKEPDSWFKGGISDAFLRRCPKTNWKHWIINDPDMIPSTPDYVGEHGFKKTGKKIVLNDPPPVFDLTHLNPVEENDVIITSEK